MAEIPSAVLSEYFQDRLQGRRLRCAAFLTFQFDPGFFEQEVLPVFFDVSLSHAPEIRLLQLEDALRELSGEIAVYYDPHGLVCDKISAKLDVRRIPVRHPTGIFHPKNVFLLVDDREEDENGLRSQSLLVATLSANLTRSGWWENVEVCHIEEIAAGAKTRLKDDLTSFIRRLRAAAPAEKQHAALDEILKFLLQTQTLERRSANGIVHSRFFSGKQTVVDFLFDVLGSQWVGANLEIISPYFNDQAESLPLKALHDRFQPKKTVVYLPHDAAGVALCNSALYHAVQELPDVSWGKFSPNKKLFRIGKQENSSERFVHAKVYRFFTTNPKREIYFIGSANLTTQAHSKGGNLETGFLFAHEPARRPEFWLDIDEDEPASFHAPSEEETAAMSRGSRVNLRYDWSRKVAEAYWNEESTAPQLRLEIHGEDLGPMPALVPLEWTRLPKSAAAVLDRLLKSTSWVTVHGDRDEPVLTLVQEDSMTHKPSLLLEFSPADILRFWSLLTPEQRAAFIGTRAADVLHTEVGAELLTRTRSAAKMDTLFDRFAGIFHAFQALETAVTDALQPEQKKGAKKGETNKKEATCRLFGTKYDSLGNLLQQISAAEYSGDDVDRYVMFLCARQLCREIRRRFGDFWRERRDDVRQLEKLLASENEVRRRLIEHGGERMSQFLDWFDRHFLERSPRTVEAKV